MNDEYWKVLNLYYNIPVSLYFKVESLFVYKYFRFLLLWMPNFKNMLTALIEPWETDHLSYLKIKFIKKKNKRE